MDNTETIIATLCESCLSKREHSGATSIEESLRLALQALNGGNLIGMHFLFNSALKRLIDMGGCPSCVNNLQKYKRRMDEITGL